jgi:hypothetical protein
MEIRGLDELVSELGEEAQTLLDEWLETRSPTVRAAQHAKEIEWKKATKRLTEARERRDRLAQPFVMQRLTKLREALSVKPISVVDANNALKEAVEKMVLDPEEGQLFIHWRDSDVVGELSVPSRHSTIFDRTSETPLATG